MSTEFEGFIVCRLQEWGGKPNQPVQWESIHGSPEAAHAEAARLWQGSTDEFGVWPVRMVLGAKRHTAKERA